MKINSPDTDVVVAGHICLDIIPGFESRLSFKDDFSPGKLLNIGGVTLSPGGAVSNTGLTLHLLGASVNLIGKTGSDEFGHILLKLFKEYDEKLLNHMVVDEQRHSSYTIVLNLPDHDRLFLHHSGANDYFRADDITVDALQGIKIFHFGYPPAMRNMYIENGSELSALMRKVRNMEVFTSLDMSMPDPNTESGQMDWVPLLTETLPYVDLFIPSLEEALFMLRRKWYETIMKENGQPSVYSVITPDLVREVAEEILDMGCSMVVIKMGQLGLYMKTSATPFKCMPSADADRKYCSHTIPSEHKTPMHKKHSLLSTDAFRDEWMHRELWAPCYKVRVSGTTGAGDSSIAGFITGLLKGLSPEDTVNMASAVGACCVEKTDATSGIISWEEVQKRIKRGWSQRKVPVDFSHWKKRGNIRTGPCDRNSKSSNL